MNILVCKTQVFKTFIFVAVLFFGGNLLASDKDRTPNYDPQQGVSSHSNGSLVREGGRNYGSGSGEVTYTRGDNSVSANGRGTFYPGGGYGSVGMSFNRRFRAYTKLMILEELGFFD